MQPLSGNLIRESRKAKGWSRAFFATTMEKSVSWVDAVETGTRQVSQKDLPKLLNTLELQVNRY
ncbi:helix-turn-helix transcriptional regulator [Nostoc sp. FACHB-892]|nr:helix-turn-helix transcriptional regulator [Nostoc sp. FACHB-892]